MTGQSQALAVLIRSVQWELDEAAFEVGGGRYSAEKRTVLADRLSELACVLRSEAQTPITVEHTHVEEVVDRRATR